MKELEEEIRWKGRFFGPEGFVRALLQSKADLLMLALIGTGVIAAFVLLGLGIVGVV